MNFWAPPPRKSCPLQMPAAHVCTHTHVQSTRKSCPLQMPAAHVYTHTSKAHVHILQRQYTHTYTLHLSALVHADCMHPSVHTHCHLHHTHCTNSSLYLHHTLHLQYMLAYTLMPKSHVNSFVVTDLEVKADSV